MTDRVNRVLGLANPTTVVRQPILPPILQPSPGLAGWIRGVLPEIPSRCFDNRRVRSLERHLNIFVSPGSVQVFRVGRGAGFVAQSIGIECAHKAMSQLYFALHCYLPRDRNKFYYAMAGWSFEAADRSCELIELGRQLIDHCDEFTGYFYLNGRIARPLRYGDAQ